MKAEQILFSVTSCPSEVMVKLLQDGWLNQRTKLYISAAAGEGDCSTTLSQAQKILTLKEKKKDLN